MPKDYAKPSTTRKNPHPAKKGPSPTLWLAAIALIGGLGAGLYYLSSQPTPTTSEKSHEAEKAAKAHIAKESPKATEQPPYKFYELLPKSTVPPSQVDAYKPKTDGKKYHYLLQTGSFRAEKDAERQKANIAFQGLRAEIQKTTAQNGVWYRVQVGPFTSRSKMNSAIDKLLTLNIRPLEKKIPLEK